MSELYRSLAERELRWLHLCIVAREGAAARKCLDEARRYQSIAEFADARRPA